MLNPLRLCVQPYCQAESLYWMILQNNADYIQWQHFRKSNANVEPLGPIQHLWDELAHRMCARPCYPASVSDLTNAIVAEWEQIHAARFQNLAGD